MLFFLLVKIPLLVCSFKTHASFCTSALVQPQVSQDQSGEVESFQQVRRGFDSGALMITPHCDLLDGMCVGERDPWRILQHYIRAETHLHTSRSIRSLFFSAEVWHYSN